jgi:hypothetical protein
MPNCEVEHDTSQYKYCIWGLVGPKIGPFNFLEMFITIMLSYVKKIKMFLTGQKVQVPFSFPSIFSILLH